MARYIDADARDRTSTGKISHKSKVDYKPTADVRENEYGEWVYKEKWHEVPTICSKCGHDFTDYVTGYEFEATGDLPNYCPNCGSRMAEVER